MTRVSEGVDKVVGHGKQVGFLGVSDLDAAERFYGGVLGLDLIDARPFALVRDTPASQVLITAVDEVHAAPYTALGWIAADLEGEMDRLAATGVSFTPLQRHGPGRPRHLDRTLRRAGRVVARPQDS